MASAAPVWTGGDWTDDVHLRNEIEPLLQKLFESDMVYREGVHPNRLLLMFDRADLDLYYSMLRWQPNERLERDRWVKIVMELQSFVDRIFVAREIILSSLARLRRVLVLQYQYRALLREPSGEWSSDENDVLCMRSGWMFTKMRKYCEMTRKFWRHVLCRQDPDAHHVLDGGLPDYFCEAMNEIPKIEAKYRYIVTLSQGHGAEVPQVDDAAADAILEGYIRPYFTWVEGDECAMKEADRWDVLRSKDLTDEDVQRFRRYEAARLRGRKMYWRAAVRSQHRERMPGDHVSRSMYKEFILTNVVDDFVRERMHSSYKWMGLGKYRRC